MSHRNRIASATHRDLDDIEMQEFDADPEPPAGDPRLIKLDKVVERLQEKASPPHAPHRSQLDRRQLTRELLIWGFFVCLFLFQTTLARRVQPVRVLTITPSLQAYFVKEGLMDLFNHEEFAFKDSHVLKTFYRVGSFEEFWQWLQGPFETALQQDHWYNGDPYEGDERHTFYNYNTLMGGIRLRQWRVRADSCQTAPQYLDLVKEGCYGFYSASVEEDASFGPSKKYKHSAANSEIATRTTSTALGQFQTLYALGGYLSDYKKGTNFTNAFAELKADRWIDRPTRAVQITFTTLNVHIENHVCGVKMLFEFTPGGLILMEARYSVVRLHPYSTTADLIRMGVEIVFFLYFLYFVFALIRDIVVARKKDHLLRWYAYFLSGWNILDFVNMLVFIYSFGLYFTFLINPDRSNWKPDEANYMPLDIPISQYVQVYNANSFNVLISFIKIFKYLRLNVRLSLLWRTLDRASSDLGGFLVLFLIMMMGFAWMGYVLFGPELDNYDTFASSFSTVFRMIMGVIDYTELSNSNRILAPVFFGLFIVFIFFILANMFLAIINDAYSVVHREAAVSKPVGETFRKNMRKLTKKMRKLGHKLKKREKPLPPPTGAPVEPVVEAELTTNEPEEITMSDKELLAKLRALRSAARLNNAIDEEELRAGLGAAASRFEQLEHEVDEKELRMEIVSRGEIPLVSTRKTSTSVLSHKPSSRTSDKPTLKVMSSFIGGPGFGGAVNQALFNVKREAKKAKEEEGAPTVPADVPPAEPKVEDKEKPVEDKKEKEKVADEAPKADEEIQV